MITQHLQKCILLNGLIGICFSFMSHLCLAGDAVPPSVKLPPYLDSMDTNSVAERLLDSNKGPVLKNDYPRTPNENSSEINVQEVASRTKKATKTVAKGLIDANTQKKAKKLFNRTKHTQPKNHKARSSYKKRLLNKAKNVSNIGKSLKTYSKLSGYYSDGLIVYNAFDLYQDGNTTGAVEEVFRMAMKKAGCYVGGAIAGTVTSPTGPGAGVAALGGCIVGEYSADKSCDAAFYLGEELEKHDTDVWNSPPGYDCVSGVTPDGHRWNDPSVKWGQDVFESKNSKDYEWSPELDDLDKAKKRNRNRYANNAKNLADEQREYDEYQESLRRQQQANSSGSADWVLPAVLGAIQVGVGVTKIMTGQQNRSQTPAVNVLPETTYRPPVMSQPVEYEEFLRRNGDRSHQPLPDCVGTCCVAHPPTGGSNGSVC